MEVIAGELQDIKLHLSAKAEDELKQLRAALEKERWMREAAMRDAMNGADIPFSWDDYVEMLADSYDATTAKGRACAEE
jgi:hypothetical protein